MVVCAQQWSSEDGAGEPEAPSEQSVRFHQQMGPQVSPVGLTLSRPSLGSGVFIRLVFRLTIVNFNRCRVYTTSLKPILICCSLKWLIKMLQPDKFKGI